MQAKSQLYVLQGGSQQSTLLLPLPSVWQQHSLPASQCPLSGDLPPVHRGCVSGGVATGLKHLSRCCRAESHHSSLPVAAAELHRARRKFWLPAPLLLQRWHRHRLESTVLEVNSVPSHYTDLFGNSELQIVVYYRDYSQSKWCMSVRHLV